MSAGIACALALAGCGTENDGPRPVESGTGAAVTNTASAGGGQASAAAGLQQRSVGPVSFRYDPDRLAVVDASLTVPPDWNRASGVKLIGSDREQLMGREECPYGQAGMDLECTPASEAGLGIVILEESFEQARERLPGERASTKTLAGREGLSWTIGVEGESSEYTILPAGNRTVLIEHRIRNRDNPDEGAIEQVKESLRIGS